ncbi:unnamed protein product [Lota lota]
MLVTMLTAMYMMVQAAESLMERVVGQPAPRPYMVHQPLPWQIHSVSRRRRSSRMDEASMAIASASMAIPCLLSCSDPTSNGTSFSSSTPPLRRVQVEEAAATIQNHFRKFQEKKQKNK